MSGETEVQPSGWTTDTLRSYMLAMFAAEAEARDAADRRYEERFEAQEKATVAALASAKEAVAKAELATERRFEATNEFRAQLADQARTFMPRSESESKYRNVEEKVEGLSNQVAAALSRTEYDRAHAELIAKVDQINTILLDKIDGVRAMSSMPRAELEARFSTIESKLAGMMPRTEVAQRMAGVDAAMSTVNSRLDTREGQSKGLKDGWGYVVGAIGAAGGVIGIVAVIVAH